MSTNSKTTDEPTSQKGHSVSIMIGVSTASTAAALFAIVGIAML